MKGIKDEMKRIRTSIKYWEGERTKLVNRLSIILNHIAVLNGKRQRIVEELAQLNIKKD